MKSLGEYVHIDSYRAFFNNSGEITFENIGKAFFMLKPPRWITMLFTLRNSIAGFFGLKTGGKGIDGQRLPDGFKLEPGERLGLFRVFSKSNTEVVIGEDDWHLNFRVSLFFERQTVGEQAIVVSTVVRFNNWFGRFYFMLVRPFHGVIVRAMLKGVVQAI